MPRRFSKPARVVRMAMTWSTTTHSIPNWAARMHFVASALRSSEILQKIVAEAGAGEEPAGRKLLQWAERYRGPHNPPRQTAPVFKAELASIAGSKEVVERGLRAYRPAPGRPDATLALHHLLERQHYRLAHW